MITTITVAQALFASTPQPSDEPTVAHIEAVVRESANRHGGPEGYAAYCAVEYGERRSREPMPWSS